MPGSFGHLANRFLDYLTAQPLRPDQVEVVDSWLSAGERELFFAQSSNDQAHGFSAGMTVGRARGDRRDLIRAAALHDIAKRHARLGVLGRTYASVAIKFRLPMSARMRLYRDHGALGAEELTEVGSPAIVIDFARAHHGERPTSIEAEDWALLVSADEPPKPSLRWRPR